MMLFNTVHFSVSMLWWFSILTKGDDTCRSLCLHRSNISSELQSDVLLPCNFNPALLGSDKSADLAVVWRQVNTTEHGLVEITLQGEVKFWDSKKGRIRTFHKLSESGNFSILLQKVQPYDLSLYRCELFNGTCSIGCQELQLGLAAVFHVPIIISGASAGAVLVCLFIAGIFYVSKTRKHQSCQESTRDCSINPIYISYREQLGPGREASVVSEDHIYETVWSRGDSMRKANV